MTRSGYDRRKRNVFRRCLNIASKGAMVQISGGSRKKYLGAWPLIIWEATTAKRNYYITN